MCVCGSYNVIDFVVVVSSTINLAMGQNNQDISVVRVLRMMRCLRPLRIISRNKVCPLPLATTRQSSLTFACVTTPRP